DVVIETGTTASRVGAIVSLGLAAVVASMPWWASSGTMRTGVELLYYLALAQIWNLMAGYGGMISFGQQAFIGIGGYVLVLLAFWLAALIGLGSIGGVYLLLRSRFGLALMALRDSEAASESVGISVMRVKTWVYVVAAAAFGLVGGLIFLTKLRISPDSAVSI